MSDTSRNARGNTGIGRRVKLNEEMLDDIVRYTASGNYIQVACAAVGLNVSTFYDYLYIGRRISERAEEEGIETSTVEDQPEWATEHEWRCYRLLDQMARAEAKSEAYAVGIIRKHFPDQWTAAMTFLERRFPGRWKRRQEIDNVDSGQVAGVDEDALLEDPAAIDLIHDALEAAASARTRAAAAGVVEGTARELPAPAEALESPTHTCE